MSKYCHQFFSASMVCRKKKKERHKRGAGCYKKSNWHRWDVHLHFYRGSARHPHQQLLSLSLFSHHIPRHPTILEELGLGFDWHWSKTGRYPHQVTIMLELATSKLGTKQLCINCLELHSHYCCSFYSKVLEFHLPWISRPSNLQHFQSGSVEREEKLSANHTVILPNNPCQVA